MSCPGLHCPGCSEGQSLGILAAAAVGLVLADQAVQWVADRIWWISGTVAVCLALATAAGMWLEAWSARRAAAWGAARGIQSRADVLQVERVRAVVVEPAPERPAIAPAIHLHFHGTPDAGHAAIIRQAINGRNER